MFNVPSRKRLLVQSAIALMLAVPCFAQDSAAVKSQFETRASLEAEEKQAEAQHRTSEAWLLKNRLENGDFQEGDRIVLVLHSDPQQLSDTLVVQAGKVIQLPRMSDLPLQGVLRSELPKKMTDHLAEYLRDPSSRVTPLVRIGVLGQVQRPGYYYTSADVLLSDAIMRAGGPGADADMSKVVIRRGADVIWSAADTRTALTDGLSLDRLHLRAGDEIQVGEKSHFSYTSALQIGSAILMAGLGLLALRS